MDELVCIAFQNFNIILLNKHLPLPKIFTHTGHLCVFLARPNLTFRLNWKIVLPTKGGRRLIRHPARMLVGVSGGSEIEVFHLFMVIALR